MRHLMRKDVDLTRAQVGVGSPSFTINVDPMVSSKASGFILTVSRDQPRSKEVDAVGPSWLWPESETREWTYHRTT